MYLLCSNTRAELDCAAEVTSSCADVRRRRSAVRTLFFGATLQCHDQLTLTILCSLAEAIVAYLNVVVVRL